MAYRIVSADHPGAEWAEGVGYYIEDAQAQRESMINHLPGVIEQFEQEARAHFARGRKAQAEADRVRALLATVTPARDGDRADG